MLWSPAETVAEKAAWELSKEHGFDLITICPGFVIGPVLGRRADATSIKTLKARPHNAMVPFAAAV